MRAYTGTFAGDFFVTRTALNEPRAGRAAVHDLVEVPRCRRWLVTEQTRKMVGAGHSVF